LETTGAVRKSIAQRAQPWFIIIEEDIRVEDMNNFDHC
jgi:hypothetical protein